MSQYIFDNAAPQAAQRFGSLSTLHDGATERYLEALGISEGWVCWEVGGGGGSIAAWLARRVGASGHVLVTDIDPRYLTALAALSLPNIQVLRHDVAQDPFPAEPFDLIHARLVFVHIATAAEVLPRLARALKPGGWLLIEDYDNRFIARTFPTADPDAATFYERIYAAQTQLLESHGAPAGWGRSLSRRFHEVGLVEVGMEGSLAVWPGRSARALLDRANLEQVRAEAIARGLLSDADFERVLALLDDPAFDLSSPTLFSAWGRRPPENGN